MYPGPDAESIFGLEQATRSTHKNVRHKPSFTIDLTEHIQPRIRTAQASPANPQSSSATAYQSARESTIRRYSPLRALSAWRAGTEGRLVYRRGRGLFHMSLLFAPTSAEQHLAAIGGSKAQLPQWPNNRRCFRSVHRLKPSLAISATINCIGMYLRRASL
jgi:hypothetical protein